MLASLIGLDWAYDHEAPDTVPIKRSQLFNLTAVISFEKDTIAGSAVEPRTDEKNQEENDVFWLLQILRGRHFPLLMIELPGKHLEPLGIRVGNYIVDLNPFDKFIEPLAGRRLEEDAATFLMQLRQRQNRPGGANGDPSITAFQEFSREPEPLGNHGATARP